MRHKFGTSDDSNLPATRYLAVWSTEAAGQSEVPFDDEHGTAAFLFKIPGTFKQTMIEMNISGLFKRLDVSLTPALSCIRFVLTRKN
jgi:hypothetical protein